MKKYHIAILVGVVLILAYIAIFPSKVETRGIYVTIDDYVGFKTDNDALYFGTIPVGGSGERILTVHHDFILPKKVVLIPTGEIADWIVFSDNNFWLDSDTNRTIIVNLFSPSQQAYGNYSGELEIEFRNI